MWGGPKESQELEKDDDSVVKIPQEPKEPDVIVIDDEEEEAPTALAEPNRAPGNGSGDCDYLYPFATWRKPRDHKPGDAMLGHIYIDPSD